MSRKPSQIIGAEHAASLQSWVMKTPLNIVPRNRSGRSSKTAICKILKIPPSTIGSNTRIRNIFESLDRKLTRAVNALPPVVAERNVEVPGASALLMLLDELDNMRAELARLSHLSNTGQWVSQ